MYDKTTLTCVYDEVYLFEGDVAKVKLNGKYGCIDKCGNEIIPCIYDYIDSFKDGYAVIMQNQKYGVIGKDGEVKVPCCYDYEWKLRNGFAEIIVNGKIALYDLENRMILVNGYDYINQVLDKYVVSFDGKYGLMNSEGKMLTDCIYDDIYEYGIRNGYFEVQLNGKFGCIDSEGNTAVPCIYDEIHSYDDEFTIVKKMVKRELLTNMGKRLCLLITTALVITMK